MLQVRYFCSKNDKVIDLSYSDINPVYRLMKKEVAVEQDLERDWEEEQEEQHIRNSVCFHNLLKIKTVKKKMILNSTIDIYWSQEVVIRCKNKKLNHERNQKYEQFKEIPLASKGWKNKKARDDYFTIHIYNNASCIFVVKCWNYSK